MAVVSSLWSQIFNHYFNLWIQKIWSPHLLFCHLWIGLNLYKNIYIQYNTWLFVWLFIIIIINTKICLSWIKQSKTFFGKDAVILTFAYQIEKKRKKQQKKKKTRTHPRCHEFSSRRCWDVFFLRSRLRLSLTDLVHWPLKLNQFNPESWWTSAPASRHHGRGKRKPTKSVDLVHRDVWNSASQLLDLKAREKYHKVVFFSRQKNVTTLIG